MEFFSRTSPPVLYLLFLHLQIALAFLFSVIFNKIRTALVMSCHESIFTTTSIAYLMWPPLHFTRQAWDRQAMGILLARIRPGDQLFLAIITMSVGYFMC